MTGKAAPHVGTAPVSLQPITAETVRAVCALAVAPEQQRFVAPNALSLAQALFEPKAWYRAVHVGEEPAGFVMLSDSSLADEPAASPDISLWRFMVDLRHQGRGVGRAALSQVIDHVRARRRFTALTTSYVPGPGCAEPFYQRLGFRPTGAVRNGEVVLARPLGDSASRP